MFIIKLHIWICTIAKKIFSNCQLYFWFNFYISEKYFIIIKIKWKIGHKITILWNNNNNKLNWYNFKPIELKKFSIKIISSKKYKLFYFTNEENYKIKFEFLKNLNISMYIILYLFLYSVEAEMMITLGHYY